MLLKPGEDNAVRHASREDLLALLPSPEVTATAPWIKVDSGYEGVCRSSS